MRDECLSNFDRSNELPLKKKHHSAKETGLKYFREKAKGSVNLRREYESDLIKKIEGKSSSLRYDFTRFDQSWSGAWRVIEGVAVYR